MKILLKLLEENEHMTDVEIQKALLKKGVDVRGQYQDLMLGLKSEGVVAQRSRTEEKDGKSRTLTGWVLIPQED